MRVQIYNDTKQEREREKKSLVVLSKKKLIKLNIIFYLKKKIIQNLKWGKKSKE